MKTNWLFSTIGKRAYIAEYLREADPKAYVIGSGDTKFTPGFAACDEAILMPEIAAPEYLDAVRRLVREREITAVLSFSDPDVARLATIREELTARGVSCFFPGETLATMGFDKLDTARWAKEHHVKAPHTVADAAQALDEIRFPMIRKPRFGSASVGVRVIHRAIDVAPPLEDSTAYIYQELIVGEEVNVEICGDLDGRPMGVSAWRKLLSRNGETELAVTVRRQDLIEHALKLSQEARIIGPCDVDLIDRDGELFLIEFNMRFGGGYPVSHLAGAKFPELLVRTHRGETPALHTGYEDGIFMMKSLRPFGGKLSQADELFSVKGTYREAAALAANAPHGD